MIESMKRLMITMAVMAVFMAVTPAVAQSYGIVFGELEVTEANASDIFGDGTAWYDAEQNKMVLQDGFIYRLSHDFVTINTGREFRIVLEGTAEMSASVDCGDPIVVEAVDEGVLKITSNISGSALKCQKLTVMTGVMLDLLSRNSPSDMHALDCDELIVNAAVIHAEVTTAQLAVAAKSMTLNNCWLQRPAGGGVNANYGGICFADGTPAKFVRIIAEGYGLQEGNVPDQNAQVEKLYEDGRIVIVKDGKRYDITGREMNK